MKFSIRNCVYGLDIALIMLCIGAFKGYDACIWTLLFFLCALVYGSFVIAEKFDVVWGIHSNRLKVLCLCIIAYIGVHFVSGDDLVDTDISDLSFDQVSFDDDEARLIIEWLGDEISFDEFSKKSNEYFMKQIEQQNTKDDVDEGTDKQ